MSGAAENNIRAADQALNRALLAACAAFDGDCTVVSRLLSTPGVNRWGDQYYSTVRSAGRLNSPRLLALLTNNGTISIPNDNAYVDLACRCAFEARHKDMGFAILQAIQPAVHGRQIQHVLEWAAVGGDEDIIAALLAHFGPAPPAADLPESHILRVLRNPTAPTVRRLLQSGWCDNERQAAVDDMAHAGQYDGLCALLEDKSFPLSDDVLCKACWPTLHFAAAMALLADHRVDPSSRHCKALRVSCCADYGPMYVRRRSEVVDFVKALLADARVNVHALQAEAIQRAQRHAPDDLLPLLLARAEQDWLAVYMELVPQD